MTGDVFVRFRMSVLLFYNAMDIGQYSPSMCFIAMVSAIENLVDLEGRLKGLKFERCKCCSQYEYKISKRFKDFMVNYVGDDSEKFRKYIGKIYSQRSIVAHLGDLLYHDLADTELDYSSTALLKNTRRIVRFALIGWLLNVDIAPNE